MFEELVLWAQMFVTDYGLIGTFIISLLESFVFPVPTAVFIAPSTALGVDPFIITVVATIGSVIGAVIGYGLGYVFGEKAANKLFRKHMGGVKKWFDKYGAWAVLIAAFTPIPFKVFAWAAGIFKLDFKKFLIVSIIGRFIQFAIAAYVGSLFGGWFLSSLALI
ncbi:MAG: DedA family protein [Nanoarchaeota archaeon]|nr:DedA family protein [Nanoarchaeota archaeon]MBU1135219.1 DedA family protein [Nanoarchaeota archaeon]MBU2519864.1 DedA family protein [Nanoarchaeota archaeon]